MKLGFLRIYLTCLWKQLHYFVSHSVKFLCCPPFQLPQDILQDMSWSSCDALLLSRSYLVPWAGAAGLGSQPSNQLQSNSSAYTPHSFPLSAGHSQKTRKFPFPNWKPTAPPRPKKAVPNLKPAKILSVFEISFKVCELTSKLGMHDKMNRWCDGIGLLSLRK